ncbi:velvet factor, partial [Sphaerosporella brunnea]
TFAHNANFFLFATLEHARPVAQARGMPAPAPAPVLTGVPVSGMAYLDRPAPAGYFIFPDLSVRHEGSYRLRFGLYEHSNEESYPLPADNLEPREFCTHRLDVKSKPFTVFSAKKFPGLAESTTLSRIVAEQGCRVRIRRDVRMRRRNDRVRGRDSEDVMDETAMIR